MVNFDQKLVNVWQNKIKYNEKCSKLLHVPSYPALPYKEFDTEILREIYIMRVVTE